MQMALGAVAYCSIILFVESCGLELLDQEEKVKLVWNFFDKLQTSVKFGSQVCDGSWVLATQTMSILIYFPGLRYPSSTQK